MKPNESRYWFRAKRYGLGWGLPLTWQGWTFFLSWMLILPLGVHVLTPGSRPMRWAFIAAMGHPVAGHLLLERRPGRTALEQRGRQLTSGRLPSSSHSHAIEFTAAA
jgi:hypothetical protein